MRNLKVLGLALVAMLALSAVGAVAASANEFTAEKSQVVLKGAKEAFTDEFLTTVGVVNCTNPSYTGTATSPSTAVTAQASYTGCTTAGVPSKIEMNNCKYVFNIQSGTGTTGDADLVCPAGSEVTVTVTPASGTHPCTVHVKTQTDIGGTVTYTGFGAGTTREITVNAELSGIDYTHTAGTGLAKCPVGSATNGTLKAKATVTAEEDPSGAHVGLFLSNV